MINIIGNNNTSDLLREIASGINTPLNIDICFGCRVHTNKDSIVLNGVKRLDAKEQLDTFGDANLLTPTWTDSLEVAKTWVREGKLIWGRRWIHTQGQDIIGSGYRPPRKKVYIGPTKQFILTPEHFNKQWLNREWWVQVIPQASIINEWRIHIFNGRSIGRGLKTQTSEPTRIQPVRNRNNGWTLVHDIEPSKYVKDCAYKAVRAVGYNFGAVDIIELTDNQCVVLEVNSAPAIRSPYTIDIYTNALLKLSEGKWIKWREKDFINDTNTNTVTG